MIQEGTGKYEILNRAEAASFIRVSEKTLGEMARSRRIPSQKVGREWRFLRSALESWLVGQGVLVDNRLIETTGQEQPAVDEAVVQYQLPISDFRDTAFSENHDRTLHRWTPWIAGFSGSFVAGGCSRA